METWLRHVDRNLDGDAEYNNYMLKYIENTDRSADLHSCLTVFSIYFFI